MRIISGKIRGKSLLTPLDNTTRPTSDKARGAVFNILEHAPWSDGIIGKRVLDAFAGTGAFGLEALSRGAQFAGFIENSNVAIRILQTNIKNCRFEDCSTVFRNDCVNLPQNSVDFFDVLFLDPPYHKGLLPKAIAELKKRNFINNDAILIAEMEKTESPDFENIEMHKEAIYGINKFVFFSMR